MRAPVLLRTLHDEPDTDWRPGEGCLRRVVATCQACLREVVFCHLRPATLNRIVLNDYRCRDCEAH